MENQPESPQSSQNTQNLNIYKIILCVEVFLIIILAITTITTKFLRPASNNSAQSSNLTTCKHRSKEELLNLLENITKDEAISIVENMHSETGCTPEGLLPEKLKLRPNEFTQEIIYSYDDISEVPNIAQDSVMGLDTESADDFLIDETTEYYTIISVDDSKINCEKPDGYQYQPSLATCYRGISFNKKYLNHYEKVEGSSHNDEMIFNDLSPDFVETALKIIMGTDVWNGGSLYDYYFEDNGDSYTLTGIYFGVGVDMNNLAGASAQNIPYAINIYEKKLILDKNTKKSSWGKYNSSLGGEASSNTLRSFSLSNDDLIKIAQFV